jgi:chemotaxis protein CheD
MHAALIGRPSDDPRQGRRILKLGPGDHAVSAAPEVLLLTVLGSCVAACIRDPVAGVGGMNHFMLPESPDGRWGRASFSLRFGNFAMEQLINDILHQGGRRERMEVKVFGGARIGPDTSAIGLRNADYVETYLKAEGLTVLARDLRGTRARRLAYLPVSGRAFVVALSDYEDSVTTAEQGFRQALRQAPPSGAVELF